MIRKPVGWRRRKHFVIDTKGIRPERVRMLFWLKERSKHYERTGSIENFTYSRKEQFSRIARNHMISYHQFRQVVNNAMRSLRVEMIIYEEIRNLLWLANSYNIWKAYVKHCNNNNLTP